LLQNWAKFKWNLQSWKKPFNIILKINFMYIGLFFWISHNSKKNWILLSDFFHDCKFHLNFAYYNMSKFCTMIPISLFITKIQNLKWSCKTSWRVLYLVMTLGLCDESLAQGLCFCWNLCLCYVVHSIFKITQ
jgi:hypothetical protein